MRSTGFPPVVDERTRKLILGTFPGEESRNKNHYYANPSNQFWKIMGDLFCFDKYAEYNHKVRALLENGIGLWDVIESCEIVGSKNKDIRNHIFNDFQTFFKRYPLIKKVFFNGKYDPGVYFREATRDFSFIHSIEFIALPYTLYLNEEKIQVWSAALK